MRSSDLKDLPEWHPWNACTVEYSPESPGARMRLYGDRTLIVWPTRRAGQSRACSLGCKQHTLGQILDTEIRLRSARPISCQVTIRLRAGFAAMLVPAYPSGSRADLGNRIMKELPTNRSQPFHEYRGLVWIRPGHCYVNNCKGGLRFEKIWQFRL